MKHLISSILITSMLLMPTSAWADGQENTAVVAPVVKGQPAPFQGVLFSPDAVAKVISDKEALERQRVLDVQHQVDLDDARLKFEVDKITTTCVADKTILQAQLDHQKNQVKILNDQLQKQTSGPGTTTWISIGAGAGIAITVLTVFALSQAQK